MTLRERLQYIPAKTKIYLSLVLVLFFSAGVFFLAQRYSADAPSEVAVSARVFNLKDFKAIEGATATYTSSLDPSSQPITVTSSAMGTFNALLPTIYYDRIYIQKEGFWDIDGSINFDSVTSGPKEIVFSTLMEEGFGVKNVHLQSIMPGDNWITTPLVPKFDDPQIAFHWIVSNISQNEGIDVQYFPVNDKLSKWQYNEQNQLTLTEGNAETFGKVTQGQSYNLKSDDEFPHVIQMDGTLPESSDINIKTAGTAFVGNTSGKIQQLSDIGVTTSDDATYSLSDAITENIISDVKIYDSIDRKEIPISNPDVVIRPGQAMYLTVKGQEDSTSADDNTVKNTYNNDLVGTIYSEGCSEKISANSSNYSYGGPIVPGDHICIIDPWTPRLSTATWPTLPAGYEATLINGDLTSWSISIPLSNGTKYTCTKDGCGDTGANTNTQIRFGKSISGHLQDSNGQSIVEASVSSSSDNIDTLEMPVETKTDNDGNYVLKVTGNYNRIFIEKDGFNSVEGSITNAQGNSWAILKINYVLSAGSGIETAQIVPFKKGQTTSFGLGKPVTNKLAVTNLVKTDDGSYKEEVIPDKIDGFDMASQKTATIDPEKFNSFPTDILNVETTRSTAVTSSYDNNTYIFGGWDKETNTPTDTIYQYDTINRYITELDTILPNATAGAASIEVAGSNRILIIGGTLVNNLRSFMIYAFNPEDQTITNYGTLPEHERYQAFYWGDRYYLFGEDNNKLTVYYLNDELNGLNMETIFNTNKVGLGTTVYTKNYKLYLMGGLKDGVPVNDIYSLPLENLPYTDDSNLTKEATTLPYPVAFPSTMTNTSPDYLYLFGGQTNATDFTDKSMSVTFNDGNINVKTLDYKLPYPSGDVAYAKDYFSNLNIFSQTDTQVNQQVSYANTLIPGQMYSVTAGSNYALILKQKAVSFDEPDTSNLDYAQTDVMFINQPGTVYKITANGAPETLYQYKLTFEGNEYNLVEGAQNNLIENIIHINDQAINLSNLSPANLKDYVVDIGDIFSFTDKADMTFSRDGGQLDPAYYSGYMLVEQLIKTYQENGIPYDQIVQFIDLLDNCTPSYFDRNSDQTQRDTCVDSINIDETTEAKINDTNSEKYAGNIIKKASAASTNWWEQLKPLTKGTKIPGAPTGAESKQDKNIFRIQQVPRGHYDTNRMPNIKEEQKKLMVDMLSTLASPYYRDNLFARAKVNGEKLKYKIPFFYKEYWCDNPAEKIGCGKDSTKLQDLYGIYWPELKSQNFTKYKPQFTNEERHRLEDDYIKYRKEAWKKYAEQTMVVYRDTSDGKARFVFEKDKTDYTLPLQFLAGEVGWSAVKPGVKAIIATKPVKSLITKLVSKEVASTSTKTIVDVAGRPLTEVKIPSAGGSLITKASKYGELPKLPEQWTFSTKEMGEILGDNFSTVVIDVPKYNTNTGKLLNVSRPLLKRQFSYYAKISSATTETETFDSILRAIISDNGGSFNVVKISYTQKLYDEIPNLILNPKFNGNGLAYSESIVTGIDPIIYNKNWNTVVMVHENWHKLLSNFLREYSSKYRIRQTSYISNLFKPGDKISPMNEMITEALTKRTVKDLKRVYPNLEFEANEYKLLTDIWDEMVKARARTTEKSILEAEDELFAMVINKGPKKALDDIFTSEITALNSTDGNILNIGYNGSFHDTLFEGFKNNWAPMRVQGTHNDFYIKVMQQLEAIK